MITFLFWVLTLKNKILRAKFYRNRLNQSLSVSFDGSELYKTFSDLSVKKHLVLIFVGLLIFYIGNMCRPFCRGPEYDQQICCSR